MNVREYNILVIYYRRERASVRALAVCTDDLINVMYGTKYDGDRIKCSVLCRCAMMR